MFMATTDLGPSPRCAEGQLCPTEEGVWWQHWLVRECTVRHAEPQLILILFTHPCSYDDTLYSTVPSPSFACRAASIVTHTHTRTSAILRLLRTNVWLKLCAAEELPLPQNTPVTQIKHTTLEQVLVNGSLQGLAWSPCVSARLCVHYQQPLTCTSAALLSSPQPSNTVVHNVDKSTANRRRAFPEVEQWRYYCL